MKNVNLLILKNVSGMNSNIFIVGSKLRMIKKKIITIENIKKVFIPKKTIMVEIILSRAFLEFVFILASIIITIIFEQSIYLTIKKIIYSKK